MDVIKRELLANVAMLPLERVLSQGGIVDTGDIDFTVLKVEVVDKRIQLRVGVFFQEVVGGCSCGDEPYSAAAYCQIQLLIDRQTARAECVSLDQGR